jgi:hypothetical protein
MSEDDPPDTTTFDSETVNKKSDDVLTADEERSNRFSERIGEQREERDTPTPPPPPESEPEQGSESES